MYGFAYLYLPLAFRRNYSKTTQDDNSQWHHGPSHSTCLNLMTGYRVDWQTLHPTQGVETICSLPSNRLESATKPPGQTVSVWTSHHRFTVLWSSVMYKFTAMIMYTQPCDPIRGLKRTQRFGCGILPYRGSPSRDQIPLAHTSRWHQDGSRHAGRETTRWPCHTTRKVYHARSLSLPHDWETSTRLFAASERRL